MKFLASIIFGLCLGCCPLLMAAATTPSETNNQDLPAFHRLEINSAMDLSVVQGPYGFSAPHLECYALHVNDGILSVSLKSHFFFSKLRKTCLGAGYGWLHVRAPQLDAITQNAGGLAVIYAPLGSQTTLRNPSHSWLEIISPHFTNLSQLHYYGNGVLNLRGFYHLNQLDIQGSLAIVNIHWIESPLLKINIRQNLRVALAGRVGTLSIEAHDHTNLDARFLRASRVFARAYDTSNIYVFALHELYGSATEKSNIYYFSNTSFVAPFTHVSGNVLPMHDIPRAILEFNPPE